MTDTLQELVNAARQAEGKQDWETAYQLWEKRAAGQQFTDEMTFCLARNAAYSGRLHRANELLTVLEDKGVDKSQAAMLRADIEELGGNYPEALKWRHKAAEYMPNSYWARYGIARAMKGTGEYTTAQVLAEMMPVLELPGIEKSGALFAAELLMTSGNRAAAEELASRFFNDEREYDSWAINTLPGMTVRKERTAARSLARGINGPGHIVDLGCWLGSLTAALAVGLKENEAPLKPRKVIAYDRFKWEESYMEQDWPGSRFGLREGEDFLPKFKQFTARWKDWIEVRKADLETVRWSRGPISLLVVDAMKTVPLARAIIANFFGSLARDSFIFHQDFCHFYTWWIHLFHYRMRHKFRVVDTVDGSGTVVFQLLEPFTPAEIDDIVRTDLTDAGLASAAFDYSLSLVTPADQREVMRAFHACEMQNDRAYRIPELEARLTRIGETKTDG